MIKIFINQNFCFELQNKLPNNCFQTFGNVSSVENQMNNIDIDGFVLIVKIASMIVIMWWQLVRLCRWI